MKDCSSLTETELLLQVQRNNEQALATLMRIHYDALYNYASRFSDDQGLIKDSIQEVFISVWQRRETAHKILSARYYFLRAVKNKVLKALYKKNNTTLVSHQGESDSFYEFSIEHIIIERQVSEEKSEKLKRMLTMLSKKQKEIIYLKYYQYLDHAQIAELMNLNRQSVYNLLHETIHKLRNLLQAEYIAQ